MFGSLDAPIMAPLLTCFSVYDPSLGFAFLAFGFFGAMSFCAASLTSSAQSEMLLESGFPDNSGCGASSKPEGDFGDLLMEEI